MGQCLERPAVIDPALARRVELHDLQVVSPSEDCVTFLSAFNLPKTELGRMEVKLMLSGVTGVQYLGNTTTSHWK